MLRHPGRSPGLTRASGSKNRAKYRGGYQTTFLYNDGGYTARVPLKEIYKIKKVFKPGKSFKTSKIS